MFLFKRARARFGIRQTDWSSHCTQNRFFRRVQQEILRTTEVCHHWWQAMICRNNK